MILTSGINAKTVPAKKESSGRTEHLLFVNP